MDIIKLIEQQVENQNNQEQEIIDQCGGLENYQWYQVSSKSLRREVPVRSPYGWN